MEHVNDAVAPFHVIRPHHGPVSVYDVARQQTVAMVNPGVGADTEQWKWAQRIARGLCYDTAGLQRAHRAGRVGFVAGLLLGSVLMFALLWVVGYVPPGQCVHVGPYTTVPNG